MKVLVALTSMYVTVWCCFAAAYSLVCMMLLFFRAFLQTNRYYIVRAHTFTHVSKLKIRSIVFSVATTCLQSSCTCIEKTWQDMVRQKHPCRLHISGLRMPLVRQRHPGQVTITHHQTKIYFMLHILIMSCCPCLHLHPWLSLSHKPRCWRLVVVCQYKKLRWLQKSSWDDCTSEKNDFESWAICCISEKLYSFCIYTILYTYV